MKMSAKKGASNPIAMASNPIARRGPDSGTSFTPIEQSIALGLARLLGHNDHR